MRRVLLIGATSAIAQVVGRLYAAQRASLFLVGRTAAKLDAVAADLQTRGGTIVGTLLWDARHWEQAPEVIKQASTALGTVEVVLIAHGNLPRQDELWQEPMRNVEEFHLNGTSVIALLSALVPVMAAQHRGVIGVISSVAGERGRAQMAAYGAAKAAVTAFTAGVRGYLYRYGVRVITIKPGFVDTPMTAHMPKNPLFASAERVGRQIYRALERGAPEVLYVPWWWRYVMAVVRAVPEALFKRVRL
jgi:hypothetical protein